MHEYDITLYSSDLLCSQLFGLAVVIAEPVLVLDTDFGEYGNLSDV